MFSSVQRAARAVSHAVASATESVAAYSHAIFFARSIYTENETLRIENQYLDARLHLLLDDRAELSRIQQQLAIQQQTPVKTVLVQVTGRATGLRSMDVFIDHGTALGVHEGSGAFTADSGGQLYVFGKVRGTYASNAMVIPLLDSRCVISGINRRTGEDVLVKGTDGDYCELSFVSPLPQFEVGDVIVTSTSSATFPPNVPIGRVDSLNGAGGTHLILRPFASIWATRYLLVALSAG